MVSCFEKKNKAAAALSVSQKLVVFASTSILVASFVLIASFSAPAHAEQYKRKLNPDAPKSRPDIKMPANLIRLPLTRQATCYTCGVSALQSVLAYYGQEYREDELAKLLKANYRNGTAYMRIARFAEENGFSVDIHKGMSISELKTLIDKKLPVICLLQAWSDVPVDYKSEWNDGHYVVAVGYDQENIFFMDPSTLGNYTYIPDSEFVDRWHDTDGKERLQHFGMVVSQEKSGYQPDIAKFME